MSKREFKIGDSIFFMKDDIPTNAVVIGTSTYIGEIEGLSGDHNQKDGTTKFLHYAAYRKVNMDKAFSSKEELLHHLGESINVIKYI